MTSIYGAEIVKMNTPAEDGFRFNNWINETKAAAINSAVDLDQAVLICRAFWQDSGFQIVKLADRVEVRLGTMGREVWVCLTIMRKVVVS